MVETADSMKVECEIEVNTTWGYPESVDPETVIFFGEDEFALSLESDAKTKKPVLCKSFQKSSVHTFGNFLNDDCFAKIDRFYPKPDYREILVHERGTSKRSTQKTSLQNKHGNLLTKKSEKLPGGVSGGHSQSKKCDSLSISGESKQSAMSPRSDISTIPKASLHPSSLPSSPTLGTKRHLNTSPSSSKLPKQETNTEVTTTTTTYSDLGLTDHTGAYPCIYCSLTCMTMNELKIHCINQHNTNKPFRCKFCPKCFRNSRQLLLHTFTHTGEKHYNCIYCPQTFRQPGHRNNHMRINHGDCYPYKCSQPKCSAVFGTSLELSRHNKENHVVRTTRCRACAVQFANHNQYKDHQCPKKNRNLNCGACGEKFCKMADVLHHAKFCKFVDPTEVTCEKCGTTFPSAAKCSVHKTYLCTGEQLKEEKVDEVILDKVKEEIVDYEDTVVESPDLLEENKTSVAIDLDSSADIANTTTDQDIPTKNEVSECQEASLVDTSAEDSNIAE